MLGEFVKFLDSQTDLADAERLLFGGGGNITQQFRGFSGFFGRVFKGFAGKLYLFDTVTDPYI
ncbi:MAG: hypothetical protein A2511_13210 [Deltaproteobacteria bacterium RIFOXYD12_FULL_50_9]|nr:MAG: hypothetical protein A2511_13210 [Deltaproteobacteria bacterium RIFOXYD12_FULL_50_9]